MSRSLAPQMITADDIMEFDLDCNAIDARGRNGFIERYLHGEIFRARPDVMAVAHSHSPSVIAFGLSNTPMRAMYHNAAFLAAGVPVFDIREKFGTTDIVISTAAKGAALAEVLADKPVALLRAHGMVAVGPKPAGRGVPRDLHRHQREHPASGAGARRSDRRARRRGGADRRRRQRPDRRPLVGFVEAARDEVNSKPAKRTRHGAAVAAGDQAGTGGCHPHAGARGIHRPQRPLQRAARRQLVLHQLRRLDARLADRRGHRRRRSRRQAGRRLQRQAAAGISDPRRGLSRAAQGQRGVPHPSAMVDLSDHDGPCRRRSCTPRRRCSATCR